MEGKALVEDYMVRDVEHMTPELTVEEATERMIATEFHGMPVAENGYLIGFITAKELLRNRDRPKARLREIIRKGTISVNPKMSIDDATRVLFRYGLRNVPVADDDRRLVGIISNIDIVRSHIERATPNKILMLKSFLESRHNVKMKIVREFLSVEGLRPTQKEVFKDELLGRQHEIRRGLVEPIIAVKRNDHYLLVDGHHRAMAAKEMGGKQFLAFVLVPDGEVHLGIERSADEMGLHTLDDVKIIEGCKHPFVEITTRFLKGE
jgi:CBS domain-containing protein